MAEAVPLLATPLDNLETAGRALARDLATTIAKSDGYHVAGLSFDDDELERRRKTLGASDIAAVCGLDPHRTALDLYLQKTGQVEPFQGNNFSEWGLRLEDAIAVKYAECFTPPVRLIRAEPVIAGASPWMSATPDRYVERHGEVHLLEVKNKSSRQAPKWGESGSDEVPFDIIAQATWQMMVTGIDRCDVAVLFGGNDFRMYHLYRDADVVERLYNDGRRFWFEHVEARNPPEIEASKASAEYLAKRFAQLTENVREATDEEAKRIRMLGTAKAAAKEIEQRITHLENQLKQAIGEDAGLQCRHGRVTWKEPSPTHVVDYEAITNRLKTYIPAEVFGNVLREFSRDRRNSRRFLTKFQED